MELGYFSMPSHPPRRNACGSRRAIIPTARSSGSISMPYQEGSRCSVIYRNRFVSDLAIVPPCRVSKRGPCRQDGPLGRIGDHHG